MYSTNNTSYQYGRLRIHMYIDSSYRIYLGKKKKKEIKIIKNKSFFYFFFNNLLCSILAKIVRQDNSL